MYKQIGVIYSKNQFSEKDEVKQTDRVRNHTGLLTIEEWKVRLEYFVYKAFAELR